MPDAPRSRIDFADPRQADGARLRLAFGPPREVLRADTVAQLRAVIERAEAAARGGAWVLGWLCYEAAPAFDPGLAVHPHPAGTPLAWFAVHDTARPWPDASAPAADARIRWQDAPPRSAFDAAWARIQDELAAGHYRQLNLTTQLRGQLEGSAQALFAALQRAQPGGYAAHVDTGDGQQVLSVSPELFLDWHSHADGRGTLLSRPMKGTAPRGRDPEHDAELARQLQTSAKERAENTLAAELLQAELARVAVPGSVRLARRFAVQALPTVWQMCSDVEADSRPGTRLWDLLAALFPGASVTGAPKAAAMQAIRALEPGPRGVYCGALGLLRPAPELGPGALTATFNLPIRTLELHGRQLRCGIGSGITAQARADDEWREWQAKRGFLDRASTPFSLLETLALEDGELRHGAEHLARLARTAAHFGYPWPADAVQHQLQALRSQYPQGRWRLRLLLDAQSRLQAEVQPLADTPLPVRLALADRPLAEAHGEWVRHKTTRRTHYAALAPAPGSGIFDTLLYNPAGEITETTFGNIAAQIDGEWITPPLHCGLLPGIGRAVALREGRLREAVLHLGDLPRVQAWAFVNSLRGWLPAQLEFNLNPAVDR